jgi:hypothetical protein
MSFMTKQSITAKIAIMYLTAGALILVWSAVWFCYQRNHGADSALWEYVCYGCLLTGGVITSIGLALGGITWATRPAQTPPEQIAPAASQISQDAANPAPVGALVPADTILVANPSGPPNPAALAARPAPANSSNKIQATPVSAR